MAATLRFHDHETFHRAALHMAIAGAAGGLLLHLGALLDPRFAAPTAALPLALLAGAVVFASLAPGRRARLRDLVLLVGATVAGAIVLRFGSALSRETSLPVAMFALLFGALLGRELSGRRLLAQTLAAGAALLLARFVLVTFALSPLLLPLPDWLAACAGGCTFAIVTALGLLPRHLQLRHDRVGDAWEACKGRLTGELRDLLERARCVWIEVEITIPPEAPVRRAIEAAVLRLFEVGRRWMGACAEQALRPADSLAARLSELDDRIGRTSDALAREQYERARGAVAEQLRYVQEIATARERVLARMHHYLAAMERLRIAAISSRSADASRLSTELQPILTDLEALGREIDCTNEAMGEMEREREPGRAASGGGAEVAN